MRAHRIFKKVKGSDSSLHKNNRSSSKQDNSAKEWPRRCSKSCIIWLIRKLLLSALAARGRARCSRVCQQYVQQGIVHAAHVVDGSWQIILLLSLCVVDLVCSRCMTMQQRVSAACACSARSCNQSCWTFNITHARARAARAVYRTCLRRWLLKVVYKLDFSGELCYN